MVARRSRPPRSRSQGTRSLKQTRLGAQTQLVPSRAVILVAPIDIHRCIDDDQSVEPPLMRLGHVMSRVQLALNVTDVEAAVSFYSKLFGVEPAKRRPGYANFAITEPPLKLVLIESGSGRGPGVVGALNHLGVEVDSAEEVHSANERLSSKGLRTDVQESTTCCYAVQDKAWVNDPDRVPWEIYTVLADAPDETAIGCSTEDCAPSQDQALTVGTKAHGADSPCC